MTSRPRVQTERLLPGLVALGLFVILAATFLTASFPDPTGFPGPGSITASIGYAMFDLAGGTYDSEGFLVAFEIIDIVLVAALVAAVMLAKTEEGGRIAGALRLETDGGTDSRTDDREDR